MGWERLVLAAVAAGAPLLLLIRRQWILWVFQGLLILAAVEWVATIPSAMEKAEAFGRPPSRTGAILLAVAVFNIVAAAALRTRRVRAIYGKRKR